MRLEGQTARALARPLALLLSLLVHAGCAASGRDAACLEVLEPFDQDASAVEIAAIVRLALGPVLEHVSDPDSLTLVLDDSWPGPVRSALAAERCVISARDLPESRELAFPENHFRLDEVVATENAAIVRGFLGPLYHPRPGVILLECGNKFEIPLNRSGAGPWEVDRENILEIIC